MADQPTTVQQRRPLGALATLVFAAFAVAAPAVIIKRQAANDNDAAGKPVTSAAAKATVVMEQIAFKPTDLTVRKGAVVTFDNRDVAPHTVTQQGGTIDSGLLNPGKSFTLTVNEPLDYVCTLHPKMKASISLSG